MTSVRIIGLAQTQARFKAITIQMQAARSSAVRAGGEALASKLAAAAPRRTGRLAAAISPEVTDAFDDALGPVAKVGAHGVPYDVFVQMGTVNMTEQAYGEEVANRPPPEIAVAMAAVFRGALTG